MLTSERDKLITNITERITAYFPSDDNRLDPDYIWEQALLTRAILIKRLIDKGNRTNDGFYSRIVLTLTDATVTDTEFSGKRRAVLPKLVDVPNNIRFIGAEDMSIEYSPVGFDGFFHLANGSEWTGSLVRYLAFKDKVVFSSEPVDTDDVEYDELAAWVILENIEDDPNFDEDNNRLIPMDYQLMLETMIADDILKYADEGLLNKTNNATDTDAV